MPPAWTFTAVLASLVYGVVAIPTFVNQTAGSSRGFPYKIPCESKLFCPGEFLKQVQLTFGRQHDPKDFVDMPAKKPSKEILSLWVELKDKSIDAVDRFVKENFGEPGEDIVPAQLQVVQLPQWITSLPNKQIATFAYQASSYWSLLLREYKKPEYFCDSCETSAIPLPFPFIVAGDRFREMYYWDSLFALNGLLLSGHIDQAWNQLQNFMFLIDTFGFIPNGARKYYLNRSQPPLFTEMVYTYYSFTSNKTFLAQAFPYIEREMLFWRTNTTLNFTINNEIHKLNRYIVESSEPRPESYTQDYDSANNVTFYFPNKTIFRNNVPVLTDTEKKDYYAELATTAESGMDFSSRFLKEPFRQGINAWVLRTLNTRSIIPVDLNAILYKAEMRLCEFAGILGNLEKSRKWRAEAQKRNEAMNALLYDSSEKIYRDYNYVDKELIRRYSLSSWTSEWAGIARPFGKLNQSDLEVIWQPIRYRTRIYVGGLPTTDIESGLQWDKPNVWAPSISFVIEGLLNTKDETLAALALEVAQDFINVTFCNWIETGGNPAVSFEYQSGQNVTNGYFFEKYNAENINISGFGGEYNVQVGFGWTNGVILSIVHQFRDKITVPTCSTL